MSNNYFRFREFIIEQQHCSMKVTTEACILGAWFAGKGLAPSRILDIGSGTGLLMMMMAQRCDCPIDGIEIEPSSHAQSMSNIAQSPWKDRLQVSNEDARTHSMGHFYDLIVTNPPFYEKSLASSDRGRNLAMHDSGLTLAQLLEVILRHLSADGSFGILLPTDRSILFEEMAMEKGCVTIDRLMVKQSPAHGHFRTILHMQKRNALKDAKAFELVIRESDGGYSEAFRSMMQPYYLSV